MFDFEVSGKHFKTKESHIISEYDEDGVYNKGSRIFKAFDIDDRDEKFPLIIKDHWHIDFHDSEDRIQESIL